MQVLIDSAGYYITSAAVGGIEGAIEVPTIPNTGLYLKDSCHRLAEDGVTWVFDEPKYLGLLNTPAPLSKEEQMQQEINTLTSTIDSILTDIIPSLMV